jgi:hypothetical protein
LYASFNRSKAQTQELHDGVLILEEKLFVVVDSATSKIIRLVGLQSTNRFGLQLLPIHLGDKFGFVRVSSELFRAFPQRRVVDEFVNRTQRKVECDLGSCAWSVE